MSKVKLFFSGVVFFVVVDFLQSYRKKLMCLNHPKGMELVWIDNLKMPYHSCGWINRITCFLDFESQESGFR